MKERNSDSKKQENLHSGVKDKIFKKAPITGAFLYIAFCIKKWYNISKLKKEDIMTFKFQCSKNIEHNFELSHFAKICPSCLSTGVSERLPEVAESETATRIKNQVIGFDF